MSFLKKLLRVEPGISLIQWAYDITASNWDKFLVVFVAAGGMSFLTYITEALRVYSPASWGFAGLLGLLIGAAVNALLARASSWRADAEYAKAVTRTGMKINPLKAEFTDERIDIREFYSRSQRPHKRKTFINCEFVGPGSMAIFSEVLMSKPEFIYSDVVPIVKGVLNSRAMFSDCTFVNCKFINMTIFMPYTDAESIYNAHDIDERLAPVFGFPVSENFNNAGK